MDLNRRNVMAGGLGLAASTLAAKTASAQDGTVYTLRYQGSHPPNQAFEQIIGSGFRSFVERLSHGRIKFEHYDAGAIVSVTGMLEATDQGVLDITQSWGAFYAGDVPEADVEVGLPLAWEQPWEAYDAYYNRGLKELIAEGYESRFHVKYFPAIISLTYGIALSREISSLSELAGTRIRAPGVYGDFAQRLGVSPVVIPGAELYTAMQLGTIDGVVYGAEAVAAASLEDFCKTMIYRPNWNTGVGHWVVNRDTWESLPEDLQQVIEFAAQYGNSAQAMDYSAAEARYIQVLEKAGVRMLELTEAEREELTAAAQETWDAVAARSDLNAQAVEIVRQQQADLGRPL